MFKPEEIIFVPSQGCNLSCKHCFTKNSSEKLDFCKIKDFLIEANNNEVNCIGFSGGEPFLNFDFLRDTVSFAVENDMYFDRIMTNGVWGKNNDERYEKLKLLEKAGFDGTIGISFDIFHNQKSEEIADFINFINEIWEYSLTIQLVSVNKSEENFKTFEMIKELSSILEMKLVFNKKQFPVSLENDEFSISIAWIDYISSDFTDKNAWNSKKWFVEDYCAGPGQVLYVHGNGDIACCCGYANEEKALIIGNIFSDSFSQVMVNAKNNEMVKLVYESGLLKKAKEMEKSGHVFPGKGRTSDNCLFCGYFIRLK